MSKEKRRNKSMPVMLGVMLFLPISGMLSNLHFTVRFDDETPGLRFRDEPGSHFERSATMFEQETGRSTATVLADSVDFLATRYGLVAACPPVPAVDLTNSDFINGNIVMVDGAWGIYRTEDLAGGPCPTTTLDPRSPALYLETIRQKADYDLDMQINGLPILWTPDVSIVQVLVLPILDGLELGGTWADEHGYYELTELNPAVLTDPYDDVIFGVMVLDWGFFEHQIELESLEPNTTTPAGAKRQTLLMTSSLFGTGVYDVALSAFATEWDEDPEATGNPAIGIPRNPYLTPSRINLRYVGTATFPFDPATSAHALCTNDFSDPMHLEICPENVPQQ
jgi:hypothetical protein